jgi:hypothetical protein
MLGGIKVEPIKRELIQSYLENFKDKTLFLHLETTNGAYAQHRDENVMNVGAYIRNSAVTFHHAKITGNGPYRVGLKMDLGWIYAEGLTDYEVGDDGKLLLAGHNVEGKLAVALQLSEKPF